MKRLLAEVERLTAANELLQAERDVLRSRVADAERRMAVAEEGAVARDFVMLEAHAEPASHPFAGRTDAPT